MAKKVDNNPWVFDAADQYEGFANLAQSTKPNFGVKPYVQRIKVDTGAGGDVLITTDGTDANVVLKADATPADDTLEWPIGARVDGIYIDTLPTNATIKVWHGYENEGS
jgi:hypothetical protein